MSKLLDDLESRGFQVTSDPDLAWAQSKVMSSLLRDAAIGGIRHVIWFSIVAAALHVWQLFRVDLFAAHVVVGLVALYSIFNPPEAFASIRNADLAQE